MVEMDTNRLTKKLFEWDYNLQRHNWSSDLLQSNLALTFERKERCSIPEAMRYLFEKYKDDWAIKVRQKPQLRTYNLCKTILQPETFQSTRDQFWHSSD